MSIGIALIGCGGIAHSHIEGYRGLYSHGVKNFTIRAVCDIDDQRALLSQKAISTFQPITPALYTDYQKMLCLEDIDAVDICLPHYLHHVVAIPCLQEHKHVLIEKPLGITMRAAQKIVEAAEKHNQILAVAENYRRTTENRTIYYAIRRGLIGKPRMISWIITGLYRHYWDWREDKLKAGGSWVFDGGVHIADLHRYWLQEEAEKIYAVTKTFEPEKMGKPVTVDDVTMAIIQFKRNLLDQWFWTRVAPGKSIHQHVIFGTKGSISLEALIQQEPRGPQRLTPLGILRHQLFEEIPQEEREWLFPKGITNTFSIEENDFLEAVRGGKEPEVDGREGYKDQAIPMAFYESAFLQKPVKVLDVENLTVEAYQREINEKHEV